MVKIVVIASAGVSLTKELIAKIQECDVNVEIIDEKNYQQHALQMPKELMFSELDYVEKQEKLLKKQSYHQQQKDLLFINKRKKKC
jgi:hypothetical protein